VSGKALREAIGFVGVTASLVFVGLEIRANTIAARASAYQDMGSAVGGIWLQAAANPDLAALSMSFFEEEEPDWSPEEEAVLVTQQIAAFRTLETTWRQVELGLLDAGALEQMGWNAQGTGAAAANTARLWPRVAPLMSPDFRAYLEAQFELSGG
jgi:hypothetical protein